MLLKHGAKVNAKDKVCFKYMTINLTNSVNTSYQLEMVCYNIQYRIVTVNTIYHLHFNRIT